MNDLPWPSHFLLRALASYPKGWVRNLVNVLQRLNDIKRVLSTGPGTLSVLIKY